MELSKRRQSSEVFRKRISSNAAIFVLLICVTNVLPGKVGVAHAASTEEVVAGSTGPVDARKPPENQVSQVRYRTRPVASFRSPSRSSNNTGSSNSSNEVDGPEPSGVPFFTVHDLSSQTFEKLQENWKNLETFLRNFQPPRRSQDESHNQRSSTSQVGGVGSENIRRSPPYTNNNVFTFKYHPVVLEGEGPSSIDGVIGGSSRNIPTRNLNGVSHFSPYPYDPRDQPSKNVDMERHTVATIYTIGICLTIMAIGSVMFILINKCDGAGGSYTRSVPASNGGSRLARSVLGAAGRAGGRQNNGRTRSSRRGVRGNGSEQATTSANIPPSANSVFESEVKILTDLPPSYDSLFPEGTSLEEIVSQPTASADTVAITASEDSSDSAKNENASSTVTVTT